MRASRLITTIGFSLAIILTLLLMLRLAEQADRFSSILSLAVPNYYARSVQTIDFALLHEQGIDCIALDIDNTLVPHGGVDVGEETIQQFRNLRDAGTIRRLAIATNRSQKHMTHIAEAMHADVAFSASPLRRKPLPSYFHAVVTSIDCPMESIAMVGDKIIQDIAGGNAAGLTTVLVDPLGPAMWLERLLIQILKRRGMELTMP